MTSRQWVHRTASAAPARAGSLLQRSPLAVNTPHDRFEQEAGRVAEAAAGSRRRSASSPLSAVPVALVQREEAPKEKTDEEKYREAAGKLGEAFLETPLGKELVEKVKNDKLVKGATEAGKSFIGTLPGKIITGAAAAGAVATLAATHKELPAQIPAIPLDVLTPGLSVEITYRGPVDKPTEAMITFKFTEQTPKGSGGAKPAMTESERYRAETARIAAENARFQAGMKYPPGSPEDLQQRADAAALARALARRAPGPDLDAMIKKYPWLQAPQPKSGLQLEMPKPSFGFKPPALLGDEYKLKLPGEKKKEDELTLQRKLAVGASNDPLEQEADRTADQVLAAPALAAVSAASNHIQRYAGPAAGPAQAAPASVDRVLAGSGAPLDLAVRQDMERRFSYDFSRVRLHTGGAAEQSAREVSAAAYTVGHNIVFGAGQFAPGTHEGRRLIAHELAHVVQQGAAAAITPAVDETAGRQAVRGPAPDPVGEVKQRGERRVQRYGHDVATCKESDVTDILWPADYLARQWLAEAITILETSPAPAYLPALLQRYFMTQTPDLKTIIGNYKTLQARFQASDYFYTCANDCAASVNRQTMGKTKVSKLFGGSGPIVLCMNNLRTQMKPDWTTAATIIHEFAHRYLGFTGDTYCDGGCEGLSPAEALKNPDSYSNLVQDLHFAKLQASRKTKTP